MVVCFKKYKANKLLNLPKGLCNLFNFQITNIYSDEGSIIILYDHCAVSLNIKLKYWCAKGAF